MKGVFEQLGMRIVGVERVWTASAWDIHLLGECTNHVVEAAVYETKTLLHNNL